LASIKFSTPEIQREWLLGSEPKAVYDYLRSVGEAAASKNPLWTAPEISDELQEELAARDDRLIDLALAEYGSSQAVLRRYWQSDEKAFRHAVAANQVVGPQPAFYKRHWKGIWYEKPDADTQLAFAQSDDAYLQRTFFTNPRIKGEWLSAVFKRNESYAEINEDQWERLVFFAIQNPSLFREISEREPFESAYHMLLTIKPTLRAASNLCKEVGELAQFELPCSAFPDPSDPEPKPDPGLTRIPWHAWRHRRTKALLMALLDRWTAAASADAEAVNAKGEEHYSYQLMRSALASRVPVFETRLRKLIKEHPAAYVRAGYYRTERYEKAEQMTADYERDGKVFLEAAVENRLLYLANHKAASDKFDELLNSHVIGDDHLEWENRQRTRARRHELAQNYFSKEPDIYLQSVWDRLVFDESDEEATSAELNELRALANQIKTLCKLSDQNDVRCDVRIILNTLGQLSLAIAERLDRLARSIQRAEARTPLSDPGKAKRYTTAWPWLVFTGGVIVGWIIWAQK
jgi:hypothetical protein